MNELTKRGRVNSYFHLGTRSGENCKNRTPIVALCSFTIPNIIILKIGLQTYISWLYCHLGYFTSFLFSFPCIWSVKWPSCPSFFSAHVVWILASRQADCWLPRHVIVCPRHVIATSRPGRLAGCRPPPPGQAGWLPAAGCRPPPPGKTCAYQFYVKKFWILKWKKK